MDLRRNSMNALLWRMQLTKLALGAVAAAVVIYSVAVLWYSATSPDLGIRCLFTSDDLPTRPASVVEGIQIRQADPQRVKLAEGYTHRPQEGDLLISIGGRRVPSFIHFNRALVELRGLAASLPEQLRLDDGTRPVLMRVDGHLYVLVEFYPRSILEAGDGVIQTSAGNAESATSTPPAPLQTWCAVQQPPRETLVLSFVWFVLEMGIFLIGALVFWKRPRDEAARLFFTMCIITVAAFMGGYHWSVIAGYSWLIFPFVISSMLVPIISLHFYHVFPRPKPWMEHHRRLTLTTVYGIPVLWMILMCGLTMRGLWLFWQERPAVEINELLEYLRRLVSWYLGLTAVWFLASVGCLVHSYRTSRTIAERNQVKWILAAATLATVPLGYTLYLSQADRAAFALGGATVPMFIASLLFTLAFAVSITRYRLMQVDEILNRGMLYVAFSFAATVVYCGMVGLGTLLVGRYFRWVELSPHVIAVGITAIVLAVVLGWLRLRFQQALDRRFYREKYQLDRAMERMSEAVGKLVDPSRLAERLLEAAQQVFGISQGAVYLRAAEPPLDLHLAAEIGEGTLPRVLPAGSPLVNGLGHEPLVLSHWLRGTGVSDAHRQLRELGGQLAQSLELENRLIGVLVLGPRRGGGVYSAEDLTFLSALVRMTGLALHGVEGQRSVEHLSNQLRAHVEKIAEQQRRIVVLQSELMNRQPALTSDVPPAFDRHSLKGSSLAMRELLDVIRKVAPSPSAVLIRGESGTGKGLVAATVHANSRRASGPFVPVHCAALAPGLLESELFGHVKGAFTGAHRDKVGRFELADGGTLFLDEIGDISLETQTKLLRVLEEMAFERVGSTETRRVDVRVIAATHQDLEALIRAGRFREDLFYRLNVISIYVPPLRERREDIFELALHFLQRYGRDAQKHITGVGDEAMEVLLRYDWPGNVRELENVIERAVALAEGQLITSADLPPELLDGASKVRITGRNADIELHEGEGLRHVSLANGPGDGNAKRRGRLSDNLGGQEREKLLEALRQAAGNKAGAARLLGLPRSTFFSKLKKHGIL